MTTFRSRNQKIKRYIKLGEHSNTKSTELIIEEVDNIVRDINAERIPIIVEGVNDKKH